MFDQLVEDRIQAAMARGDFDNLPGVGRPLQLDDDRLVPEHLRVGMRILKNAGLIPQELLALREANQMQSQLASEGIDDAERRRAKLRLRILLARLEESGLLHTSRAVLHKYQEALLARLSEPDLREAAADEHTHR